MSLVYKLLSGILISANCLSQSFIDTNKIWHVGQWSGFAPNSVFTQIYKFKHDSIVNNQSYTVLMQTYDTTQTNWYDVGLIREDTILKKVYWLIDNQEELLYDFNLSVGDTAKVVSSFGFPYPNCGFEMIVDSIAYHNYFGVLRKHWYFNTPYYNNPEIWIEGIGNLFGPIENKVFVCTADYLPDLLCYSEGTELKWINSSYNDCYINTTGFSENQYSLEVMCYPNPSNDIFQIQTNCSGNKIIQIYNTLGELVFDSHTSSYQFEIHLNNPGFYFLNVKSATEIQTIKILKL